MANDKSNPKFTNIPIDDDDLEYRFLPTDMAKTRVGLQGDDIGDVSDGCGHSWKDIEKGKRGK